MGKKDNNLIFRINTDRKRELKDEAKKQGLSVSQLIEKAISNFLNN